MGADFVARAALDGVVEDRFHVVTPTRRADVDAIRARHEEILAAVRAPDD